MMAARGSCIIEVTGLEVFAHHGVLASEKEQGQRFIIDIKLEMFSPPQGDDLAATVDYARVASEASRVATSTEHDLIETVAREIAEVLLRDPLIARASVTVSKPEAPMPVPVANVSVTVTMDSPAKESQ
ncbi:MAG TPA: dihydroneopterin aldolase [Candidatus Anoxymicrobiaceae bacterium]